MYHRAALTSAFRAWLRISHGGQSRYRSDPAASGFRRPLDPIDRPELRTGARVPAERTLAAAAGVLRRRQGSVT